MNEPLKITTEDSLNPVRLDFYLSTHQDCINLGLSRTKIKALIESGCVMVNDHVITAPDYDKLSHVAITLMAKPLEPINLQPENIPLDILFEDQHLLIVNKPRGMVVHPAPGHFTGTLVNALLHHCGQTLANRASPTRPGIVHRIDKDTSGLLVVAKDDFTYQGLVKIFMDHGRTQHLKRDYLAIVWGVPKIQSGTIKTNFGRHPFHQEKFAVYPDGKKGKEAITHWQVKETYLNKMSQMQCRLETGRTHQIRVHMDHIGHNIVGDPLYSQKFLSKENTLPKAAKTLLHTIGGQLLHATSLGFAHPVSHKILDFTSPLPDDIGQFLAALAFDD